jgi:hypothetical protein
MMTLAVSFDTQSFCREDYDKIASGGLLMNTAGLLNLRWEEFSAVNRAQELRLHGVVWDTVWDNTPGSLTCTFRYDALTPELEISLLAPSVLEYDILEYDILEYDRDC